jgi:2-keto-3-deoxy-L-rhamnonate aldolase RhmA
MTGLRIDSLWAQERTAFGCWLTVDSFRVVEAMVAAEVDFVGIDCQHTMLDENDAARLLRPLVETEIATFVRVQANEASQIGLCLDAGADGVIVPFVNTAADAQRAVAACRYPPDGVRSFGPQHSDLGRVPATIQSRARCFVMLETAEAVDNLEEICATPGLAGTYLGPVDLAIGLGLQDPFEDPPPSHFVDAVARIRTATVGAGLVPAIHAMSTARAASNAADGFRMVTLRADFLQLTDAVRRDLTEVRG